MPRPFAPNPITNLLVKCEASLQPRVRPWMLHLFRKGSSYWLTVAFIIPLGMIAGDWLGQLDFWIIKRYEIYQWLQKVAPDPPYAKRTVLVFIQDEEYWRGALARRAPIKRDYLANLIRKIDEGDPQLIALDFNLSSPDPDQTSADNADYQCETDDFVQAIRSVAQNRKIVLPRTLSIERHKERSWLLLQTERDEHTADPAIYDGIHEANVRVGHINLPKDVRQIPLTVMTKNDGEMDSFAAAIVRSVDKTAIQKAEEKGKDGLPYGTYMTPDKFEKPLSAGDVLRTDPKALKSQLGSKIVIVGASWHQDAFGRGEQIDTHLTPVGAIGGAYIHANYVEALLDTRTHAQMGKIPSILIEVFISIAVALIFASDLNALKRAAMVTIACLFVAGLAYVAWQNLGLFFDFFLPILLLGGHVAVEQVLEWRNAARQFQTLEKGAQHATASD